MVCENTLIFFASKSYENRENGILDNGRFQTSTERRSTRVRFLRRCDPETNRLSSAAVWSLDRPPCKYPKRMWSFIQNHLYNLYMISIDSLDKGGGCTRKLYNAWFYWTFRFIPLKEKYPKPETARENKKETASQPVCIIPYDHQNVKQNHLTAWMIPLQNEIRLCGGCFRNRQSFLPGYIKIKKCC